MEGGAELRAWYEAVNAGDAEAAGRVATEDVRLGGPRGTAQGLDALRGWIAEAGIRLAPVGRHAVGPGVVVAEEDATWPGRAGADPPGPPVRVFSAYLLRDGKVAAVLRHESLDAALDAGRGLLERP
jgi:hypothetical protein